MGAESNSSSKSVEEVMVRAQKKEVTGSVAAQGQTSARMRHGQWEPWTRQW